MPKLLSRSKHEEFKSNSALQIRDEKERRGENAKNLELQEIPTCTVHAPDIIHPSNIILLLFHAFVVFVAIFRFFPFRPCNSF